MYFFEYVNGIVALKSNDQYFACSFGGKLAECNEDEFDACELQATVYFLPNREVYKRIDAVKSEGKFLRFNYFSIDAENNILFYDRTLSHFVNLCFLLKVENKKFSLYVGNTYKKFVKLKISNLHPASEIVSDVLEMLLLRNGYATLYCASAYSTETKRAVLMFSAPHTGKTLTCMQLCNSFNFEYVSEDFAVTNGRTIYGATWTRSFRDYDKKNSTIQGNSNGIAWLCHQKHKNSADPANIFLLENNANNSMRQVDDLRSFEEKLLSLQRFAVHYYSSPTVTVLGYADSRYQQDTLMEYEQHIIHKLCQNTLNWYITSSDVDEFSKEIAQTTRIEKT